MYCVLVVQWTTESGISLINIHKTTFGEHILTLGIMLYAIKLFIPLNLLFFSGEFITHVNGSGWLHQVIRFLSSWKSQTEKQSWLMGTSNIAPKIQTFTKNEIDTLPWSILSHSVELLHLFVVYQWQKLLHQISQSTRTFKTKAVQW